MRRLVALLAFCGLAALAVLPGCGYYSFSGASVPEGVSTVAIPPVENGAALPITTLPAELTRLLVDRFTQRTRLRLDDNAETADAVLEARIESYRTEPTSVTATDLAARNRLTIGLRVTFRRRISAEGGGPEGTAPIVDRSFSAFADYDPGGLPAEREAEAARSVLVNLADDVFTAATSNW
ncbi:MAG: LPS assembly lipoprotein LptE [Bacteroidetes bacterium]|nr:LPS assembly lipoprotein LptE [Bacteroidota bacterium]